MKKLCVLILCLALLLTTGTALADVIKLGGLAPLTGTYSEYGVGFEVGFAMALEEINGAGGVNGYTFEIDVQDSEGDTVTSTTLATQFAEDDEIMALLGGLHLRRVQGQRGDLRPVRHHPALSDRLCG